MADVDLVLYNTSSRHGDSHYVLGREVALQIDGVDKAESVGAKRIGANNLGCNAFAIWAGAGPLTSVKGRFRSNVAGQTVTIHDRVLLWLRISNSNLKYVLSAVEFATTSATFVNDTPALINFSTTELCTLIVIYNPSTKYDVTSHSDGWWSRILVDGVAVGSEHREHQAKPVQVPVVAYKANLAVGDHTIQGQVHAHTGGNTIRVSQRQLIAIIIPNSKLGGIADARGVNSETGVSTSSGTFVDDTPAVLSFSTTKAWKAIILYQASNPDNPMEYRGRELVIGVDGVDYDVSRSSQAGSGAPGNYVNNNISVLYVDLAAGAHTIQGRFRANAAGQTVYIDHRNLVCLLIP